MAKKKMTRKELLKTQDEFLTTSARLLQFVIKHKVQISCVFGGVFVLIIIFSGIRYFSIKAEKKAFALMQQGISRYETALKENEPQKAFQKIDKEFQLILKKYSRKEGGKLARVIYENMCNRAGGFDQEIDLYEKALEDFDDNDLLKDFILSGLGYNYEGKKDYQTAAMYFEKIVSTPKAFMNDDAFFILGWIYVAMCQTNKISDSYKIIVSEYPESIYYEIAKEKLSG